MPKISTVILAAGASKRLGFNKLCIRVNGEAVVRRTTRLFIEAEAGDITVVTGFERERVEEALSGLPVRFVHHGRHEDGMSASIKAALPMVIDSDLVLFHLGDKPFVTLEVIRGVMEAGRATEASIVVPVHRGIPGHPVLIDMRRHRETVGAVRGQGGLRDVIGAAGADARFIEGGEGAILDLDTEEDVANLKRRGYKVEKD
jgi:molybdenum cofactor cytidylyltransferase